MPAEATWLKFYEWAKEYGPIYGQEMFGSYHVWISSEQIAHDLLGRRNVIYSDRPMIPNLPDNRTSGDYLALLGRTGRQYSSASASQSLMVACRHMEASAQTLPSSHEPERQARAPRLPDP